MARNFVKTGKYLNLIAPYAVSSGGGALINATFGVAQSDVANAEEGVFNVEGVFTLTKAVGATNGGGAGVRAYWNNTTKNVTAIISGNTLIGVFTVTCADGDATCVVRLNGSF